MAASDAVHTPLGACEYRFLQSGDGLPSAGGAKGLCPLDPRASAAGGRALPCTRDFFGKKSSKNLIPPAGGMGASRPQLGAGAMLPRRRARSGATG
ncbi:hypothetical protein D7X33_05405 [Butyricicoccus sp. 1XD8-22]|nr:hypothetical protein D7X33_05405 [Butyricicoccus sp. 1XD8-22]